ncbi:MAG: polyphosphate kinase 2 family protein [Flavobacteriaceae bacterium]|nr:polyphosphate kinase 2 family protein [Flavobacteriaceae bacterium]
MIDQNFQLNQQATDLNTNYSNKQIKKKLKKVRRELSEIQNTLYAHAKYSVLVCFQGMDSSGKDSLIREVFKDFNIRGVVAHSFKKPSLKELQHDFLWRHYKALPGRGKFGVFNRSHYENVLISQVHPSIVLNENLPTVQSIDDLTPDFWEQRINQINNFEKHIAFNGMIVLKFFLNISKEEQRQRLLRRLEKPNKNWKFAPEDIKERKLWNKYIEVYDEVMKKSSFPHAPWYCVPSDNKHLSRLIVAEIILETMKSYTDIKNPPVTDEVKKNLKDYIEGLQPS